MNEPSLTVGLLPRIKWQLNAKRCSLPRLAFNFKITAVKIHDLSDD